MFINFEINHLYTFFNIIKFYIVVVNNKKCRLKLYFEFINILNDLFIILMLLFSNAMNLISFY